MLGIQDWAVALAYLLCIASTILCVVHAWRNWRDEPETAGPDDVKWAATEDKVEEDL